MINKEIIIGRMVPLSRSFQSTVFRSHCFQINASELGHDISVEIVVTCMCLYECRCAPSFVTTDESKVKVTGNDWGE